MNTVACTAVYVGVHMWICMCVGIYVSMLVCMWVGGLGG
jgi:hypothetical protein